MAKNRAVEEAKQAQEMVEEMLKENKDNNNGEAQQKLLEVVGQLQEQLQGQKNMLMKYEPRLKKKEKEVKELSKELKQLRVDLANARLEEDKAKKEAEAKAKKEEAKQQYVTERVDMKIKNLAKRGYEAPLPTQTIGLNQYPFLDRVNSIPRCG